METITVTPKAETSLFVDVFTTVVPIIIVTMIILSIVAIIYIFKLANRYIANGKIAEQKLQMEQTEIKDIKERLEQIEKKLNTIDS